MAPSTGSEVARLLDVVSSKSIELWLEGDRLAHRDPQGLLSETESLALRQREAEIVAELRQGNFITQTFPLSYGQRSLWFMHQAMRKSPAYNIALAVRIRCFLNAPALRESLQILLDRHASLRTVFSVGQDGELRQQVYAWRPLSFEQTDVAGWSEEEVDAALTEAYRVPFHLSTGPLLRAHLYTDGAQRHTLLLTIHHIVFDGASMFHLLEELQETYGNAQAGRRASLRPIKSSYRDFVAWQAEMMGSPEGRGHIQWWKQQLAGAQHILDLPTDFPRPTNVTGRGGSIVFELPQDLVEGLKNVARDVGVHLYEVLLAAYQVLLHRYSGQQDILTGFLTAGRPQLRFAKLSGFFINPVVVRSVLTGDPRFADYLRQQHETVTQSLEHQDLPFLALMDHSQVTRLPGCMPLVQVLFNFFKVPRGAQFGELFVTGHVGESVESPGLRLESAGLRQDDGEFDLVLEAAEGKRFWCRFKYSAELFRHETVARLTDHYRRLLSGIAGDAGRPISGLPMLSAAEREQLLVTWNQTEVDYPLDTCVHQLIEAQVARTPDAVALVFEDRQLTYAQLNREANALAHYLRERGIGPEVLVGICVDRSVEMLVGLLAILKAGGAYVPLDPHFPKSRLELILADARPRVILTQRHLSHLVEGSDASVLPVDTEQAGYAGCSGENLPALVSGANTAYVLYTSGSTGTPKGVQILHSSFTNFQLSMRERPGLSTADVLLAITTISFDIAGLELFLPLIVGARVIVTPREKLLDGRVLAEIIGRHGVTVMQATPATWHLLLDAGWTGAKGLKVLCGGEALTRELANQLLARTGSLWNMYGPTETTVWSTVHDVKPGPDPIPLGTAIANTTLYILDRHLQPVPVGVSGELYIGGAGLARGYLNRQALTDERFLADPFRGEPGARMYKTGDGALYRPDGSIIFLGRLDDQVKVRGHRIELGDIERALLRHPSVREAAVIVREDPGSGKRLVAFLIPHTGRDAASAGDLRDYLLAELPDYMVPSAFAYLEALPLTPNNKVDRKALRSVSVGYQETNRDYLPPARPPKLRWPHSGRRG